MSTQTTAAEPFYSSESLETGIVGPYQDSDRRVIDYRQFVLAGNVFRGPLPAQIYRRRKLVFLGAAQTFGRFVRLPFPDLVGSLVNRDVLNLGYAGAGASFYLRNDELLLLASNSEAVVVQAMSGRSTENSVFASPDGRNTLVRRSDGRRMTDAPAYRWALGQGADFALNLVRESQRRWVSEMTELARRITTRKVLLWLSVRSPDFEPRAETLETLMGEFPHFVSRQMLEEVAPHFDVMVECTSRRGLPFTLRDRFDGTAVEVDFAGSRRTRNTYYPSPEMHLDAARALEEPLRAVLSAQR